MAINEPETKTEEQRDKVKKSIGTLLLGGLIVVVSNSNQAHIAERYGARAVIVINGHPSTFQSRDQSLRCADPSIVRTIMSSVMLPVIGRVRFGHIPEARAMESCGVAAVDENFTLGIGVLRSLPYKSFNVPVIADAMDLEEGLLNICKGATMLRTGLTKGAKKGARENAEPLGTFAYERPNIAKTVTVFINIRNEITAMSLLSDQLQQDYANKSGIPISLLKDTIRLGRFTVPFFAEGGIMFPIDAAMMMEVGYDGVITSNQLFFGSNPETRVRAIVMAMAHYKNPEMISYIAEENGYAGADPSHAYS